MRQLFKPCKVCGEYKANTPEYYSVVKGYTRNVCKVCHGQQVSDWNKNNLCLTPEKRKYYRERYVEKHGREAARERSRKYYQENKSKRQDYFKKWRHDNLELNREHSARYNARKKTATVGDVCYEEIYKRDNGICHICGKTPKDFHFDHVMPLSRGGAHSEENIRVACAICNMKKKNKLMSEYVTVNCG